MNTISDHIKPLVNEIYSREPDFNNDIIVLPNKIIIKKTELFPSFKTIQLI